LGSLPPSMRATLNSEWLPQTRQVSCGLSLSTSHSTHKTAFCSGTAFRTLAPSAEPATRKPFITEPLQNSRLVLPTFSPLSSSMLS
jgi:hypothetical protein